MRVSGVQFHRFEKCCSTFMVATFTQSRYDYLVFTIKTWGIYSVELRIPGDKVLLYIQSKLGGYILYTIILKINNNKRLSSVRVMVIVLI